VLGEKDDKESAENLLYSRQLKKKKREREILGDWVINNAVL